MTIEAPAGRPAVVRVMRATGRVATIAGVLIAIPSLAIGAVNGFDKTWTALFLLSVPLVLAGVTALLAVRQTRMGLVFGLLSCSLLLLLPIVGWLVIVVIVIVASQSLSQLRDYYGLHRRVA